MPRQRTSHVFLECRNVTATMRAPAPVSVPVPSRELCGCVLVRPRASCDSEDLMRCDVVRGDLQAPGWFWCTRDFVGVRACMSVCLSVQMRRGVLEANQGLWELGWHLSHSHRIANAPPSHIQMHRVPGAKTDSPLLPTTPPF